MLKITCAILCYNYGRYLKRAIESCLLQQKGDYELEVLVIDDGSTDNTPEICQSFGSSIIVFRSPNEGFASSLTKAIRYATGDYICLLDADDYFELNKINRILPFCHQGYLFIKHRQSYINEQGNLLGKYEGGGNTSTLVLQRAASLTLLPIENELFFHPLYDAGRGIALADVLTNYRIHDSNMTNRKDPGVQHNYLASITFGLTHMLERNKELFFWTSPNEVPGIISTYKAIGFYNCMEASVQLGERLNVLKSGVKMFMHALQSREGITQWHLRVFIRCFVQMRTLSGFAKK